MSIDWFCLCISSKLAVSVLLKFELTNRIRACQLKKVFPVCRNMHQTFFGWTMPSRLRLREDRLGLTGTLTSAWVVHPPAHAFSQGHGVSVSIIHLPHFQSRRDSTQPWPCNRLSFRVETSHGHYLKITQRERERWHITAMVTNRRALCLQTLCGRPNPSFKMRGLYFTLSSDHSRYCQLVFTLFSVFTLNDRQTSAIYYTRVCVPLPVFCFLLLQLCEKALKKFLCLTTGKLWSSAHILIKCLIPGLH